jgi:osmoprotectant transport system permease protein
MDAGMIVSVGGCTNSLRKLTVLLILALAAGSACAVDTLRIGSKRFTESYVLGELLLRTAARDGAAVHRQGMGNTGILVAALRGDAIDVYPEYSGTIAREVLKMEGNPSLDSLNRELAPLGLAVSTPLGFNNSYALGMREEQASRLGIRAIGDLVGKHSLKFGLSHEFLARQDGWPGLAKTYGLAGITPSGLDHGIAYEALAAQRVHVIDLYSTDAKIPRYRMRVLTDDKSYFPRYEALLLHRAEVPARYPAQWRALQALAGRIDEARMIEMNAAAELEGQTFAQAAALFDAAPKAAGDSAQHGAQSGTQSNMAAKTSAPRGFWDALFAPDLWRLTREHLILVFGSLAASLVVGLPLGVLAAKKAALAQPIFAVVGVIQTIPSLALLAFLIALMGSIGIGPAAVALFLYALLPIVRNTHTGMLGVGDGMRQAAIALGLSARDRLLTIEVPLARPAILAGIKTSAVINVGTATIAAFIGAGGYGERIASGLALNDHIQLLAGAVPAAALALLIQGMFEWMERYWAVPGRSRS